MYYKKYGMGERTFIGFHGWTGSHETFAPIAPYVPENASLYSFDLPGCGRSEKPDPFTLEQITEEVVLSVKSVPAETFTLIGMCTGAIIGVLAAGELKPHLSRLVLIDPFAYVPWYFRVFLQSGWGWYAYASTFANPIGRWLTNTALKNKRTEETDLTDSFATIDHKVTYNYLKLFGEIEGIERFRHITLPIEIAYGERTFGAIKSSLPRWQEIWPQARCWKMKGAGHFPLQEATAQISDIIFSEEEQS